MTNISILAAGPPKPGRQRHLELLNGVPLISEIINKCTAPESKVHVVVNKNNSILIDYYSLKTKLFIVLLKVLFHQKVIVLWFVEI